MVWVNAANCENIQPNFLNWTCAKPPHPAPFHVPTGILVPTATRRNAQWRILRFSANKVREHVFFGIPSFSYWYQCLYFSKISMDYQFESVMTMKHTVKVASSARSQWAGRRGALKSLGQSEPVSSDKFYDTKQRLQWIYSTAYNFPDYKAPVWSALNIPTYFDFFAFWSRKSTMNVTHGTNETFTALWKAPRVT